MDIETLQSRLTDARAAMQRLDQKLPDPIRYRRPSLIRWMQIVETAFFLIIIPSCIDHAYAHGLAFYAGVFMIVWQMSDVTFTALWLYLTRRGRRFFSTLVEYVW